MENENSMIPEIDGQCKVFDINNNSPKSGLLIIQKNTYRQHLDFFEPVDLINAILDTAAEIRKQPANNVFVGVYRGFDKFINIMIMERYDVPKIAKRIAADRGSDLFYDAPNGKMMRFIS